MDTMIFIMYYLLLAFTGVIYFLFRKKGLFSISDAIMVATFFLVSLGGYYNSYGLRVGMNELNISIFLDYLIFLSIVPLGLLLGAKINIPSHSFIEMGNDVKLNRLYILLGLVIIYACVYFVFIRDSIPLLLLLTGKISDPRELALLRLSITHDYDSNYDIPFFLRYYRLVINDLMRFILVIVFLFYLDNQKKFKTLFIITTILTLLFHTYHFEKSGVIYILLTIFFSYVMYKNVNLKNNFSLYFKILTLVLVALISMYMLFMGVQSIGQALSNLFNRAVLGQSGMIYVQDIVLKEKYGGILWGSGVPTFLLDSALNRDIINLSKEAYGLLFSSYASQGGGGTTGGMPMFFLRSNFGYILGTIILFGLSFVTGMIDQNLKKVIKSSSKNKIIIALYAVLIIYFVQAFISNFMKVYMLPMIVSPQILIILLALLFVMQPKRSLS